MLLIKRLKKVILAVLCAAVIACLSGCTIGLDTTTDSFLSPPRARGEMYEIEQALKQSVKEKFTLKYPTDGDHRSAYVLTDITSSGVDDFAIAFYSVLNSENIATMHLNLMKKTGEEWLSISDISILAVGVEKVEIIDLDNDDIKEIIVGWNVYGGTSKKVMVYSLKGLTLAPRIQEAYTDFVCCDLIGNAKSGLFLLEHNTTQATAVAKYYTFETEGVQETGRCVVDGAVASFSDLALGKLTNGTTAIFIDSVKGTGMQTEIVFFRGDTLVAPMSQESPQTVSPTYRENSIACMDINNDGFIDIPLSMPTAEFPLQADSESLNPITKWCAYNGSEFKLTMYAAMNYTDGYYLEIPDKWLKVVTVGREVEARLRTVYIWDIENAKVLSELVRIRTVPKADWDKQNNGFSEYTEIIRSEGLVYAAMFGGYYGPERIDENELKALFHVLG